MSIWFQKDLSLPQLLPMGNNTMTEFLGIQFTELGDNFLKASMPVDHRTMQPHGLLHGGASVVLAETLGSVGATLVVDPQKYFCVGLEINANHIRAVKKGMVTGTATPIHLGNRTHVWDIKIHDEDFKLVCTSRITIMIMKHQVSPTE